MLLGDRVASAVVEQFDNLKSRGKPQGKEWTVLAGIVAQDTRTECCTAVAGANSSPCSCLRVISLATGNKCVGRDKIPDDGSVVHDSHAEVLARRALLLRLWRELHLRVSSAAGRQQDVTIDERKGGGTPCNSGRSDGRSTPSSSTTAATVDAHPQPPLYGGVLPGEDDGRILLLERSPQATDAGACISWRLKPYIRLHLYISDAPCGDASIYEQKRQAPNVGGGGSARCGGGDGDPGNDSSWDDAPRSTPLAGSRSDGERRGRGDADRGDAKRARCAVAIAGLSDAVAPSPRPDLPLDEERSCSAASLNPLDCKPREPEEQQVGALRIKSSRSNISEEGRTMSMSCSDKLAKWAFLGVQGGLLASWVEPIFLSSIVISADPRTDGPAPLASALTRAIPGRAALANRRSSFDGTTGTVGGEEHLSHPPMPREEEEERMAVFVSEVTFARSKAQSEQRVFDDEGSCSSTSGVGSPGSITPAKATVSSVKASPSIADASIAAGSARQRMPGDNDRSGRETSQGTRSDNSIIGKRSRRDRKPKKVVPSGTSLNWIEGLGTGRGTGPGGGDTARIQAEVTLSATGRMQGAVSKGVLTLRTRSRLCRARLLEAANLVARAYLPQRAPMCDHHYSDIEGTGEETETVQAGEGASGSEGPESGGRSYWRLKQASRAYRVRREAMLSTPTFRAWLVGGKDKQRFAVDERTGVVLLAKAPASRPPPTRS
ncbi:conserved unknown protein [Ectocarpus siliculosus]|uniref:tRNA-specific adenosine deaminase 1 n=1 Tax=Ectocarpus siliculosus TaxID=2880 RepID=D8LI40_ECTSI|nr:conserved unknown protein [Ectocarpus siliculosus]|eukprot:CBN79376.1 conserved unknown protein [Ectocarpus siliculosus]